MVNKMARTKKKETPKRKLKIPRPEFEVGRALQGAVSGLNKLLDEADALGMNVDVTFEDRVIETPYGPRRFVTKTVLHINQLAYES